MSVTVLEGDPDAPLAVALARFEREFTYPLGPGRRFRIAHGGDAWRFFHALGEAAYALDRDAAGAVVGALGAALRRAVAPHGGERDVLYLGDLKVAGAARGGLVLIRLMRALRARFADRTQAAFAVVMDGTDLTPAAYTGRLGIPAFAPADTVAILWLRTGGAAAEPGGDGARGPACFAELAAGAWHLPHSRPEVRSLLPPRWLVAADGAACGRLEDTLRAKRLHAGDGEDMRSAHLSCLAWRDPAAGLRLLEAALAAAARAGYPLLFTAMAPAQAEALRAPLGARLRSLATATVFATGTDSPGRWLIDTAEI